MGYNPTQPEESVIELDTKPSLFHWPSLLLASFVFAFAALFANGQKLEMDLYFGPRHVEINMVPSDNIADTNK
jgi:hypothetical protein